MGPIVGSARSDGRQSARLASAHGRASIAGSGIRRPPCDPGDRSCSKVAEGSSKLPRVVQSTWTIEATAWMAVARKRAAIFSESEYRR